MPDIVVHGLVKRFGRREALRGIDLTVPDGQMCGLVGADGAGKTTLLRCIAGLERPDAGTVEPGRGHEREIGFAQQGFHLYEDLTVAENLEFFGSLFGLSASHRLDRAAELLEFAGLAGTMPVLTGHLSGGMKQKLTLVCSLLHAPATVLLDEPTTGVDPLSRSEFWNLVEQLHADGSTVLVASAYIDEVERCEHVVFLDAGRVRLAGSPDELRGTHPTLESALLAEMTS